MSRYHDISSNVRQSIGKCLDDYMFAEGLIDNPESIGAAVGVGLAGAIYDFIAVSEAVNATLRSGVGKNGFEEELDNIQPRAEQIRQSILKILRVLLEERQELVR